MAYEEMHWDDFFILNFSLFIVEMANGNLCFISYCGLTLIVFGVKTTSKLSLFFLFDHKFLMIILGVDTVSCVLGNLE